MGFGDHVATAFKHLHTAFGADDELPTITWDPEDANITCDAIVGSVRTSPDFDSGEDHVETRTVVVQTADVADPKVGDEVLIGSDIWKVVEIPQTGYGTATVKLARSEPVARSHEGHTKRMV